MDDLIILSRFGKSETIRRLQQIFAEANEYDLEMQVLHGEFYLKPVLHPHSNNLIILNPFSIQFRLKEDYKTGLTKLEITPQSKAFSITIGVLVLFLLWLFILVATLDNKGWLDPIAYLISVAITGVVFLLIYAGNRKEKEILAMLTKEFSS